MANHLWAELNALDRSIATLEVVLSGKREHRERLVHRIARESHLSATAPADDGRDWETPRGPAGVFPATLPADEPDDAALIEAARHAALETVADEPDGLLDFDALGEPLRKHAAAATGGISLGPAS